MPAQIYYRQFIDSSEIDQFESTAKTIYDMPENEGHFGVTGDIAAWVQAIAAILVLYLEWRKLRVEAGNSAVFAVFQEQKAESIKGRIHETVGEVNASRKELCLTRIERMIGNQEVPKTLVRLEHEFGE